MIYSTLNHQELPFSDPTHPPTHLFDDVILEWSLNKKKTFFQNGLLSAAPHIWTVIAGQIFGSVSDLLLTKNLVPKGILRKSMHTFGFLFPAAGIGLLGYILDDWKISVAIMTIGYGFRGATYSGHALVTIFFLLFS